MEMSKLNFQMVVVCLLLQVPSCVPSCNVKGSVAHCGFQNLRWVPPLPAHITHLYLEMNRIAEINATSMSGLMHLQKLDLGSQAATLLIRNNSFSGQRRLRKLVLSFNPGLRLEPLAFAGLSNLLNLDLSSCRLNDSILADTYLEPLTSLETLDLFGNHIERLQPSPVFRNMTQLTSLNLKLNGISEICEPDLAAFTEKHLRFFSLNSVSLTKMSGQRFDWSGCGNPFKGMSFHTLDLSGNAFGAQSLNLFLRAIEGTKIYHLKLSGPIGKGFSFNNLPDPDRTTFVGLQNSSVAHLDLSKNRIFALHPHLFSPLGEVRSIDLSQNKVNQIQKNAFHGLRGHLKSLNLSRNLMGELFSHTFESLTSLELLDLSHNHIGAVGYRSFSGLPNLKVLHLNGNSLRDLGFPQSLPSLNYLTLSDNKLTSTSITALYGFAKNVTHLDIRNNRLTNLGDVQAVMNQLGRLQSLLFGGNSFQWCTLRHRAAPNNLTYLDLHGSSLQLLWDQSKCLDLFDNCGKVIGLNLSHNHIKSLPRHVFRGLTSVEWMDLSSNALTYLQDEDLPETLKSLDLSDNFLASPHPALFRSLAFVDLSENRFLCSSELRDFLTWLSRTAVTFVRPVQELRCEFPSALRGVKLLDYSVQLLKR